MADNGMIIRNDNMDSICMDWNRNDFVRYLHAVLGHRL